MPTSDPLKRRLSDLQLDLRIERDKLSELVGSLERLGGRMQAGSASSETFDSATLRLQSLYTGAERCLRLRKAIATESRPAPPVRVGLAELLAFRHVVRHLYAYELEADRVRLLLQRAIALWPGIETDLGRFQAWLEELVAA